MLLDTLFLWELISMCSSAAVYFRGIHFLYLSSGRNYPQSTEDLILERDIYF